MKHLIAILLLLLSYNSLSQETIRPDSNIVNKNRLIGISSGVGSVWTGSMLGLWQVWYKGVEKSKWHSFDDSRNWLQMDKAGHFYTAHKLNQLNYGLFRWTGLDPDRSLLISSSISFGYQFTLEMFDAFSQEWGFSWSDMSANALGTASFALQQKFWGEERIIPKYSYSPSPYAHYRPEVLGSTFAESLLKDYNGQTYWMSFSPFSFMKSSNLPEWLCISIGYSANKKLVGSSEYYTDPVSGTVFHSQRELILSFDIDFSKLDIKREWLRVMLKQLNYLKIPFPAFVLRQGDSFLHPFYF